MLNNKIFKSLLLAHLYFASPIHAIGNDFKSEVYVKMSELDWQEYDVDSEESNATIYRLSDELLSIYSELLNRFFIFKKPLYLIGMDCGNSNAYYLASENSLVLCNELIQSLILQASSTIEEPNDVDLERGFSYVTSVLLFALMHEVAHALIDNLDLPITGREEDVADQLASLFLIMAEEGEDEGETALYTHVLNLRSWFLLQTATSYSLEEYADEHAMNEQRLYNFACYAYGNSPETSHRYIQSGILTSSRAERCPGEYNRMEKSWGLILRDHMKRFAPPTQH